MRHYLLVDLGTGNTRVALVNSAGAILDLRTYLNRYYRDGLYEDAQYFLPVEWRENILQGCRELCAAHPDIRVDALSSAGTRQSFVLLDREGKDFYGLPNIDNRGRAFMDEVPDHKEIYRLSGKWATEDFGAAKLLGLRKKRPELYGRIWKFTSISEWIAWIFTGRTVMEYSQASETQLYDIGSRTWSPELCAAYGVELELLPELQAAGTATGPILPEYREAFHLASDAVFLLGGADTQTALRQTALEGGGIAVVSGTTSPVISKLDRPLYDPEQRFWLDADLGGERFLAETNPGVTGLNYQRMHQQLCPDIPYERLEELYLEKDAFACTASFSSLLFHERRCLRSGGFFTRSPAAVELDRVDMLWAVLADIACSIQEQLSSLVQLTGNEGGVLLGCGGGFQSPALCQMLADLSGRELRLRDGFRQASVWGLSAVCSGYFGLSNHSGTDVLRSFPPRAGQLIHAYYPVWRANRDRVNPG